MSKEKKAGIYDHVTPALVKQVNAVLAEAENHTYSVSRVFAAFNAVMQKRDTPQTCSSCLRNRVRDLKKWKAEYEKATTPKAVKVVNTPDPLTYDVLVARLGLVLGNSDIEELATLCTVLGVKDYPVTLTDEERGLIQARYDKLTFENPTLFDKADVAPQYDDPSAPGYVEQADGTVRYPMVEGIPFDFLPNEGTIVKGLVTRADGSKVKPGTYTTAMGLEIAVQPGGKATIKEEDLT